jgi:hypothetical protein
MLSDWRAGLGCILLGNIFRPQNMYNSAAIVFHYSTPQVFIVLNHPTVLLSLSFTKRDRARGCRYFCMRHKPWNLEGEGDASIETSYITYKQRSVASQNNGILEYYFTLLLYVVFTIFRLRIRSAGVWCRAVWQTIICVVVYILSSNFTLSSSYRQLPKLNTDSQIFAKTVNSNNQPDRSVIKYKPIN